MAIDIQLLRIMRKRDEFHKLMPNIVPAALDKQTAAILADYKEYFDSFEHAEIDLSTFIPRFHRRHPSLTDEQKNAYEGILKQIGSEVDEGTRNGILANLYELKLGTDLANLLAQFEEGELADAPARFMEALDCYKRNAGIREASWINDDIGELLGQESDQSGYEWRLQCLRDSMRGLRPGDFGIVAGRPDKGKTTFLASEVTYLARQLPEDKNVVWLNNEGPGKRIVPRLYQAALGYTVSDLIKQHQLGRLVTEYEYAVGRTDRIRVVDIHGMNNYQVESIVEANSAGIVLYDMIDNVKGFGDAARTDLQLERMYQWARELGVKHEFVGIATSQISNEGDGLQFPTLGMLKDSKTGKQGACDFQLMIGAANDPGLANARFISLPKNKLRREGKPGDPRATVQFRGDIARYEDIVEAVE